MDDETLLNRYVKDDDSDAFAELVRRYGHLVKTACGRVLGNSHDAEEVVQECFLEMAQNAGQIHTSVGGWLVRAATSRSLNVLRSRIRRKVREKAVGIATETMEAASQVAHQELQTLISTALTEMPEVLRLPMIMHFFHGRSQRDVAVELGVNQSTISRRMNDALQRLREALTQAGYVTTVPTVMVLMQDQSAIAASEYGFSHGAITSAAGKTAGGMTVAGAFKAAGTVALSTLSYLMFGGWVSLMIAIVTTIYVARYRPIWLEDLFDSLGLPNFYEQQTLLFSQREWKAPSSSLLKKGGRHLAARQFMGCFQITTEPVQPVPVFQQAAKGSRIQIFSSIVWSILFLGLSISFTIGTRQTPGGIVALGLGVSVISMTHAIRTFFQVRSVRNSQTSDRNNFRSKTVVAGDSEKRDSREEQTWLLPTLSHEFQWFDVLQLVVIGSGGAGIMTNLVLRPVLNTVWPSILMCGFIGSWMLCSVIVCLLNRSTRLKMDFHRSKPAVHKNLSSVNFISDAETPTSRTHSQPESEPIDTETNQLKPGQRIRSHSGSRILAATGIAVVVSLSFCIAWNPTTVQRLTHSLAALQTSILGWIVFRLCVNCLRFEWKTARQFAIIMLLTCFASNSGVCLANWLR